MNETGGTKELFEIIGDYFNSKEHINTVYIFGSAAGKDVSLVRDIDIGLLFKDNQYTFDKIEALTCLSRLIGKEVDIVVLNGASELLKYQVRKKNRIIFDKNSRYRKQFEIKSRQNFEDYLYIHKIYFSALKKRILSNDGLSAR